MQFNEREDNKINAGIECMARNLETQSDPMVGIFWYDQYNDELFGVNSVYASELDFYDSSLFSESVKTSKLLHKTKWEKEYFRKKDKRFTGDYTKVPRGRVFEIKDSGFCICVGTWIKDHINVIEMVKEEFQLPENTIIKIDSHWDIGHGWSEEF